MSWLRSTSWQDSLLDVSVHNLGGGWKEGTKPIGNTEHYTWGVCRAKPQQNPLHFFHGTFPECFNPLCLFGHSIKNLYCICLYCICSFPIHHKAHQQEASPKAETITGLRGVSSLITLANNLYLFVCLLPEL